MADYELVRYHILSSIRASVAESNGYSEEADKMRAQGNLRLMIMTDDELRELARMLSYLPSRPKETVYEELKHSIEEQKACAAGWIGTFGVDPYDETPSNKKPS